MNSPLSTSLLGECQHCHAGNSYSMLVCRECGARLPWAAALEDERRKQQAQKASLPKTTLIPQPLPKATPHSPADDDGIPLLPALGALLLGGGLLSAAYFGLIFDPTLSGADYGLSGRFYNIGLLSQRQNGIMIGMGAAIVGAILLALGKNSSASISVGGAGPRLYAIIGLGAFVIIGMLVYLLLP